MIKEKSPSAACSEPSCSGGGGFGACALAAKGTSAVVAGPMPYIILRACLSDSRAAVVP